MNILLIGGGGREHALAWKIKQSPLLNDLHAIPGSDAIAALGAQCHGDVSVEDHAAIVAFCEDHVIDLVVVGPEAPLVDGLADALRAEEISVFGPSKDAARLEGSKAFMKDICMKHGIPTAAYGRFTNIEEAKAYIDQKGTPIVIKADGLAAGKGVIIAQTQEEANAAVDDMLKHNRFGNAGAEIVVEEYLEGEEVSFFVLSDGENLLALTSAQDHKRAYDNDEGPNTGGMGAYSPACFMSDDLCDTVMEKVIKPTAKAMQREGCSFSGVFFAGLMMVKRKDGTLQPRLIEYNVRFGDPECQTLMMRMKSDIVPLLLGCAEGNLDLVASTLEWHDDYALCVVMAANGYPGSYEKGTPIDLSKVEETNDTALFHAGTKRAEGSAGQWLSNGGRVLCSTAKAKTFKEAQNKAYNMVDNVTWKEGFFRRDIGSKAEV